VFSKQLTAKDTHPATWEHLGTTSRSVISYIRTVRDINRTDTAWDSQGNQQKIATAVFPFLRAIVKMKTSKQRNERTTMKAANKQQLANAGYRIEDVGQEHGPQFIGCYRWMHDATGTFQDHHMSFSENDAWQCAANDLLYFKPNQ